MKIELRGNCLNKGTSRVEVEKGDGFSLLVHNKSGLPQNVPLEIDNMGVEDHLVSLGHEVRVDIVEHLFSALFGLNLFDVKIRVFGSELPFFDGSSRQYTDKLKSLVTDTSPSASKFQEKILVSHNSSYLLYEPIDNDELIIDMELFHPFINKQKISLVINKETYLSDIAPARTFVFTDEADPRLKDLPPYGIGITKDNVYAREPLRYEDELVRHKILDLLGDLYVLKRKVLGRITGRNTSHLLNLEFARELIKRI
jgi:UDP-3-O-acyl-N-acetylglucosamine deacetylase